LSLPKEQQVDATNYIIDNSLSVRQAQEHIQNIKKLESTPNENETPNKTKKTIVVDNVHQFEGHIACDAKTNSEIVVPIILEEKVFGVLDLDSYGLSAFSERDKFYLEKIIELLKKIITLHKFNLT
jgi:GAF domain-containing protein